jgi:hypothetical protein
MRVLRDFLEIDHQSLCGVGLQEGDETLQPRLAFGGIGQ